MIRIGVLRGGTGARYDESLDGGAFVLRNLPRDKYQPVDIFIDQEGIWHIGGKPVSFDTLRQRVDVLWNALYGFYGEDGKIQQSLEMLGIPHIGSGPLASSIAMNNKLTKERLAAIGVETPRGIYIEGWGTGSRDSTVFGVVGSVARKFSPPWIVEPIARARASGAVKCKTREELSIVLSQMCDLGIPVLVEEAVTGRAASVIAVRGFRGEPVYTFPAIYTQDSLLRMQHEESEAMQKIAEHIHGGLSLGQYSRVEAVVTPKGKIIVTRIETLPHMYAAADLHPVLASTGASFSEFADHLISLAMRDR